MTDTASPDNGPMARSLPRDEGVISDLEMRAFSAANSEWTIPQYQQLVADLWRACCDGSEVPSPEPEEEPDLSGLSTKRLAELSLGKRACRSASFEAIESTPSQLRPITPQVLWDNHYKKYQADFDSMDDEALERERRMAEDEINFNAEWLEALAVWKQIGRPRNPKSEPEEPREFP